MCSREGSETFMGLEMSIAAMSVDLAQARTQQSLGISVLKEAMALGGEETLGLLSDVVESLDPNLGTLVDIQA